MSLLKFIHKYFLTLDLFSQIKFYYLCKRFTSSDPQVHVGLALLSIWQKPCDTFVRIWCPWSGRPHLGFHNVIFSSETTGDIDKLALGRYHCTLCTIYIRTSWLALLKLKCPQKKKINLNTDGIGLCVSPTRNKTLCTITKK